MDLLNDSSMGINIPQVLVAGIENLAMSSGNIKNSAIIAASVGVSNLVPVYSSYYDSATEKYLIEPIVAGVLYSAVSHFMKTGEKKEGIMKNLVKGFLLGSSSAAVSGAIQATTKTTKPKSLYSSVEPGLRSAVNIPTTAPKFIVS